MDSDDLSALPPEDAIFPRQNSFSSKRSSKTRPSSLNPKWYQTHYDRDVSVSPVASLSGAEGNGYFPEVRNIQSTSFPSLSQSSSRTNPPNIIAPTPRRHLIETSESQHWLNLHHPEFSPPSPASPTGSIISINEGRGISPSTPTFPSNQRRPSSIASSTSAVNLAGGYGSVRSRGTGSTNPSHSPVSHHQRSFSALYQYEQGNKTLRRRQVSNASIASSATVTTNAGLHKAALLRSKQTHPHGEGAEQASGRRWVRWMHKNGLKAWVIPLSIALATLVKLCIGVGSYSGETTPPMYGDYEAQRHWMELTTHLPFQEWYTYDLQYWGLDYPPLTAYVSWMCGLIAHYLNPEWVALDASRGIETPGSKLFMRLSVVILDFLVYIPALVMFVRTWQGSRSHRTQEQAFLTLVLQPALLVIDHGHFQYNSVMLGFTLLAINFFTQGDDLYGAVCFVMSLGFKQMALYYAPAIGSYLLAKCIWLGWEKGLRLFIRLGATTVLSFGALFAPFFLPPFAPSVTHILHPITRIFPFNRGLFEDKVANFWCASNVAIKWKRLAISAANGDEDKARGWLVKLSTLLTALGFSPSVVGILRSSWIAKLEAEADGTDARKEEPPVFISLLPYALLTSSMSFFLFSFQVHEKTILLPLLPLTLLMSAAQPGTTLHNWGALGNNVAVFSMWPLLKRDGQGLACVATLMLWNRAIGYNPFKWIQHKSSTIKENLRIASLLSLSFVQLVSLLAYAASICLVLLEFVLPVPKRYPDLFPVLNVLVSTPIFVLIWLWSIKCGLEIWWTLGGWGSTTSKKQTTSEKRLSASGPAVKPLEVKTSEGSGSSEVVGGSMDSPISI